MRNKKRFIIISNHLFNGHMRAKSIHNISKNWSKCEDKNASINPMRSANRKLMIIQIIQWICACKIISKNKWKLSAECVNQSNAEQKAYDHSSPSFNGQVRVKSNQHNLKFSIKIVEPMCRKTKNKSVKKSDAEQEAYDHSNHSFYGKCVWHHHSHVKTNKRKESDAEQKAYDHSSHSFNR